MDSGLDEGRFIVVDLDLEKFFDRVNHDVLMALLSRRIGDKALLRTIHRFLEAGIMAEGVCIRRHEGTPQGGPLSPLLANILLDDLGKELEARGHSFCRYADDCNIYVQSRKAGERVMASVVRFLEQRLGLKVNRDKSAVAHVEERKFLGYRLLRAGRLGIASKSVERMKERVRAITRRNRGVSFGRVGSELRCYRLRQCKRAKAIHDSLHRQGVPWQCAWTTATRGKGWWRMAATPQAHEAMTTQWFHDQGVICLQHQYEALSR